MGSQNIFQGLPVCRGLLQGGWIQPRGVEESLIVWEVGEGQERLLECGRRVSLGWWGGGGSVRLIP